MIAGPVGGLASIPIRELARLMAEAAFHQVVVMDECHHPIAVVSSLDVAHAVAYAPGEGAHSAPPERRYGFASRGESDTRV